MSVMLPDDVDPDLVDTLSINGERVSKFSFMQNAAMRNMSTLVSTLGVIDADKVDNDLAHKAFLSVVGAEHLWNMLKERFSGHWSKEDEDESDKSKDSDSTGHKGN